MTPESKKFFKALKALCVVHGVEIEEGSRFWILGKDRKQCERFGVQKHLESKLYDKKIQQSMARGGLKDSLDLIDMTKTNILKIPHKAAREILGIQPGGPFPNIIEV